MKVVYTAHGYNNVWANNQKLEGGEDDLKCLSAMKFFLPSKVSSKEHLDRFKNRFNYTEEFEKLIKSNYPDYKESIDKFPVLVKKVDDDGLLVAMPFKEVRETFEAIYNSGKYFSEENVKTLSNAVGFNLWLTFRWEQNYIPS